MTTGQITRIGRHFGAQVVNDLLVGFKYHADVLAQLEATGQYGDVRGTPADFVIATEESHGILATQAIRDKDSACAALLLAEVALFEKRQGRTLVDYLDDLNRQFGYFRNELLNIVMTGLEGKLNMARCSTPCAHRRRRRSADLPVVGVRGLARRGWPNGAVQRRDGQGRTQLPDLPARWSRRGRPRRFVCDRAARSRKQKRTSRSVRSR